MTPAATLDQYWWKAMMIDPQFQHHGAQDPGQHGIGEQVVHQACQIRQSDRDDHGGQCDERSDHASECPGALRNDSAVA